MVVIVADRRTHRQDRFPFLSRVDAERYMNAARSRGFQAWIEGEAVQATESLTPA